MTKYNGLRKFCGGCKYYNNCRMIDHDKIKLYKSYFKTYESIKNNCDICCYYEPANWDLTSQQNWTDIQDYTEWLDKEFYPTLHEGESKLDYAVRKCLIYNNDEFIVSLRNWLDGTAVKENKINYIFWYKTKGKKRILYNESGSIGIK